MIVVGIALSRAIMWSYLVSSLVLWLTGPVAGYGINREELKTRMV